MLTVNVHEAKTQLSKILDRVLAGEEVIIAKAGRPVARLVPLESPWVVREPGKYAGRIRMSDDFGSPLPDDLLSDFEGRSD